MKQAPFVRVLRSVILILGLAATAAGLAACGDDARSGSSATAAIARELRDAGFGDYLGAQQPYRTETRGGWTHLYFDPADEKAICLYGTEFQASYRRGVRDELLIFLEGGGACWDFPTCHILRTATTTARDAGTGGIFDLDDPRNPFRGWSVLYVPYCDGSVFTGDKTVAYNGIRTYHHGFWNLSAALTAAAVEFPDPARIVVSGSSAGGYGTFAGYAAARVAWPENEIVSFNDSGPGLQNFAAAESVQARLDNWDFAGRIPASCERCSEQYTYLYNWTFARDPMARVALYSTQQDMVIRAFLSMSGLAYGELLLAVTDQIQAEWPTRFRRYFPQGDVHTILRSPAFYTRAVNGVSIRDWTQAFLDDSAAWVDVIEE